MSINKKGCYGINTQVYKTNHLKYFKILHKVPFFMSVSVSSTISFIRMFTFFQLLEIQSIDLVYQILRHLLHYFT